MMRAASSGYAFFDKGKLNGFSEKLFPNLQCFNPSSLPFNLRSPPFHQTCSRSTRTHGRTGNKPLQRSRILKAGVEGCHRPCDTQKLNANISWCTAVTIDRGT
jgi:hypothetical protein